MAENETSRAPTGEKPGSDADAKNGAHDGHIQGETPSSAPELPANEMSFAEMFELAEKQQEEKRKAAKNAYGNLRPGQVINAKVVGMSADSVFLDVGAKAEGVIPKIELADETGEAHVAEGDIVEARVRKFEGGTVILTKVLPHQSIKNRESIREAYDAGLPVEGKVTEKNKGGYDVEIAGLRAFCPQSQIDIRPQKADIYIGKKFPFRIVEFKDNGRNIVVSRRSLLDEEKKRMAEKILGTLTVGARVHGEVTSVKDYGAFVDLGGVEGLVHLSEISHGHLNKPQEKLKVGDQVMAQILKIEEGKDGAKKISLSMKALLNDPWASAVELIREGAKVKGKVARIQNFGAFVELLPGVDGLIHISNMASGGRVKDPRDVVKEGDEVEATVISTDWDKRRIGLSLVKTKQELAGELERNQVLEGTVDKIEGFGLFVKLPTGARGLVPAAETGTQRGADLKKEFREGQKVKVAVLETDHKSGKIRLSIRAAVEAEERAEYAGYLNTGSAPSGGSSLGTLGDLFKHKLGQRKSE
jgi:small subunit ribosomal protein S1